MASAKLERRRGVKGRHSGSMVVTLANSTGMWVHQSYKHFEYLGSVNGKEEYIR